MVCFYLFTVLCALFSLHYLLFTVHYSLIIVAEDSEAELALVGGL